MTRPSYWKMVIRGLRRRCPWCGGRGAYFVGWFGRGPHCRTCGLRWRRGDVGFELGAATMAVMMTLGPLLVVLGAAVAATWPTIPVVPVLIALVPAALVLPVVIYPVSYTVWQALDIVMRPVSPDDFEILDRSFD